jgi:hypothetical protein
MSAHKKYLWVYGYVSYEDFLGNRHVCRFCKSLFIAKTGHVFVDSSLTPNKYVESD